MNRRIDWNEKKKHRKQGAVADEDDDAMDTSVVEDDNDDDEVISALIQNNRCDEVWFGQVQKPAFKKFRFHQCTGHKQARDLLAKRGIGHYWDMVVNFQPLDEAF
jgi:U4/U6 small nuclear ribonucleoprotein PRP3